MKYVTRIVLLITIMLSIAAPNAAFSAPKKSAGGSDALDQYMDSLQKNPNDHALREKIIKLVLGMKRAPALSEAAERSMARGTSFAQKAADDAGYKKAIAEFEIAVNEAPWLALAYYNMGVVQEKAGQYAEAIQSLKMYVLAAPDAKNVRDVKNKIYALEADMEDLKASKSAPAPAPVAAAPAPAPAAGGKTLAIAAKPTLELEQEKDLLVIKMPPPEKKSKIPTFLGTWAYKDTLRGEELTIQAFEIAKNAAGDIVVNPPKRAADSYASVTLFELNEKSLKLQLRWKMRSVVGYWKTETYELTLSEDGKTLSGTHNQKSIGGRNVDMDRVLVRQ